MRTKIFLLSLMLCFSSACGNNDDSSKDEPSSPKKDDLTTDDAVEVANSCNGVCPVGTAVKQLREVSESNEISGGFDPETQEAEGAYIKVVEGSCEWACVIIQPCGEGLFPIITKECFTCGAMNDEGYIVSPSCSTEEETE